MLSQDCSDPTTRTVLTRCWQAITQNVLAYGFANFSLVTDGRAATAWLVCFETVYRVIARANSTARIAAATASGQKLSLGELSTGCIVARSAAGVCH